MKSFCTRSLLAIAMIFLVPLANAGLIELTASAVDPSPNPNLGVNDFSIIYNDTGDGLLQLAEIISFSGVEFFFVADPSFFQAGDAVLGVADIAGISSSGLPSQDAVWQFRNSGGTIFSGLPIGDEWGAATRYWEYSAQAVPVPTAFGLLLAGLAGLGLSRRKIL